MIESNVEPEMRERALQLLEKLNVFATTDTDLGLNRVMEFGRNIKGLRVAATRKV